VCVLLYLELVVCRCEYALRVMNLLYMGEVCVGVFRTFNSSQCVYGIIFQILVCLVYVAFILCFSPTVHFHACVVFL